MQQKPQAVFFDLDETLINNTLNADQLFSRLSREHLGNLEGPRLKQFMERLFLHATNTWNELFDNHKNYTTHPLVDCFASSCADIDSDPALAFAIFEDFLKIASEATRLNESAIYTLENVRSLGFKTGIITNGFEVLQMTKITRHRLDELVDQVIISERAGAHKPDSQVFNYALGKLNVTAREAWHVGDHLQNDVAGAIKSGMTGVFYDPSAEGKEDKESKRGKLAEREVEPHYVIRDLEEVVALLSPR